MIGKQTKAINDRRDVLRSEPRNEPGPQQHGFILKNERHRHGNPDVPSADRLEYLEARSPLGSESRNKD